MIGKRLGNYTIRSQIGQGGMGIVYEAYDHSLHRKVALKVIPPHLARQPDIISRFRKEARAAARLSHPSIVEIYGIGREGDIHFFVMEYLEGVSLEKILQEEGRLPCPLSLKIVDQVAGALELAHRKGFIHRDIKPSNIMLNRRTGLVKVTDFGIAKALEEGSQLTASDARLGTPRYMSPEQVRGEKLDPRSDLFSLGVVLFQMLTGKTPFRGDSFLVVMRKIIEDPPEYPPGTQAAIPEKVRAILDKLLAKEPDRRYQTAGELMEDIKNYRTGKELSPPGKMIKPAAGDIARLIILAGAAGGLIYLLVQIHPAAIKPPPLPRSALNSAAPSPAPAGNERNKKSRELFRKAEDLLRRNPGQSAPAVALFTQVVDDFPGTHWSKQAENRLQELNYKKRFDQGMEAMIKQNWRGAIIAFEQAQSSRKTREVKKQLQRAHLFQLLNAGETYARKGEIKEALRAYRDALKLDPGRAETAAEIKRLERLAEEKTRLEKEFAGALNAGKSHLKAGEYEKAGSDFRRALSYKPGDPEARLLREETRRKIALLPATLTLQVLPPQASIYLDGNFRGRAADFASLTATPGRHTVKVQSPGHIPETRTVDLIGGKKYPFTVTLRPYPKEKKKHRVIPIGVF